mgnify:CR=1 FL=1
MNYDKKQYTSRIIDNNIFENQDIYSKNYLLKVCIFKF